MKKLFLILSAVLLLSLCGCKKDSDHLGERGINVYYRSDDTRESGSLIGKSFFPLSASADPLHEALNRLTESPEKSEGLCSAFPSNIQIETYSLEGSEISVCLTGGYSSLPPLDRTVLRCCLVLTLCELNEVESVNIYEEDRPVELSLTSAILLPESMEDSSRQLELTLWFPSADGGFLIPEQRKLTVAQFKPVEEYVLEELFRGPHGKNAKNAIPAGTRLLSVHISGGTCTVDLSGEFYANRPSDGQTERLTVYSVVNTMTELSGVKRVLITVEGKTVDCFRHMSLSKPLERCEEFSEAYLKKQNWNLINMYMLGADDRLVAVPMSVEDLEYPDYAKMTLKAAAFLTGLENMRGYYAPIPRGVKVMDVETADRICTLVLSPELWSCDANQITWAVRALTATATDVGGFEGVRIRAGERDYQDGEILRKEADWIAD